MRISTDGQRSSTNHCPNCPYVQLYPQLGLSCPANPARLFNISPEHPGDRIFSDKDVEVAEDVFNSFRVI
ncbi:hypothetical protein TNCV_2605501 [Trichonephila clavipes]|nr:hypothetical protein TNCV_2605501 [Trichonephila clavipes]